MKVHRKKLRDLSDKEIWNLFKSGDNLAFKYIYETYFDRLYNYGHQFTKNTELVEDTLQDLFIELYNRSSNLSSVDKILPYLYTAFRRKIIRYRDKMGKFTILDSVESFSVDSNVEDLIIENETNWEQEVVLRDALSRLTEKNREILYLFYYENLSYSEIKEIIGFENVKSVRNLLYKSINVLKKGVEAILVILFMLAPFFNV